MEKAKFTLESFIEKLSSEETGVVYHKLKEDQDVIDGKTKTVESYGKTKAGQYYTLCIVVDPTKNTPPIIPDEDIERSEDEIGNIVDIPDETIKSEKGLLGKLSSWVKLFYEMFLKVCDEQPVFFELRPLAFKE